MIHLVIIITVICTVWFQAWFIGRSGARVHGRVGAGSKAGSGTVAPLAATATNLTWRDARVTRSHVMVGILSSTTFSKFVLTDLLNKIHVYKDYVYLFFCPTYLLFWVETWVYSCHIYVSCIIKTKYKHVLNEYVWFCQWLMKRKKVSEQSYTKHQSKRIVLKNYVEKWVLN